MEDLRLYARSYGTMNVPYQTLRPGRTVPDRETAQTVPPFDPNKPTLVLQDTDEILSPLWQKVIDAFQAAACVPWWCCSTPNKLTDEKPSDKQGKIFQQESSKLLQDFVDKQPEGSIIMFFGLAHVGLCEWFQRPNYYITDFSSSFDGKIYLDIGNEELVDHKYQREVIDYVNDPGVKEIVKSGEAPLSIFMMRDRIVSDSDEDLRKYVHQFGYTHVRPEIASAALAKMVRMISTGGSYIYKTTTDTNVRLAATKKLQIELLKNMPRSVDVREAFKLSAGYHSYVAWVPSRVDRFVVCGSNAHVQ